MKGLLAGTLGALALAGCGGPAPQPDTAPQHWQGLDVRVESRPSPPVVGMNEFLVIVTGAHGRAASECLVALRTADGDPWKQAIQDGHVAVYRRAAETALGERSVLQVQLNCEENTGVLRFPLNLAR